ncbi:MAG: hypothetical protein ACLFVG_10590 [Candidatus Aminicenantes bacterium]
MNTRKAILVYQYSEKIKSELIIAFKLLAKMNTFKGAERKGAEELMHSFLEGLLGEIRIAQGTEKSDSLLKAEEKVIEAIGKIYEFSEISLSISEALSAITTSCQRSMEELENKNLL